MSYLEILKENQRKKYISSQEYDILYKLYNLINEKNLTNKQFMNIKKLNDEVYDELEDAFNVNLEIYEIEDKKLYPKYFIEKYILLLENVECLMQTNSYIKEDVDLLNTILKGEK